MGAENSEGSGDAGPRRSTRDGRRGGTRCSSAAPRAGSDLTAWAARPARGIGGRHRSAIWASPVQFGVAVSEGGGGHAQLHRAGGNLRGPGRAAVEGAREAKFGEGAEVHEFGDGQSDLARPKGHRVQVSHAGYPRNPKQPVKPPQGVC